MTSNTPPPLDMLGALAAVEAKAETHAPLTPAPGKGLVLIRLDPSGVINRAVTMGDAIVSAPDHLLIGQPVDTLSDEAHTARLHDEVAAVIADAASRGIGRHWLHGASAPDVLVEIFVDASDGADGDVDLVLRDVTQAYVDEQKQRALATQGEVALLPLETALTRWTPDLALHYHSPEFEPLVLADRDLLLEAPNLDDVGFTPTAQRRWSNVLSAVVRTGMDSEFSWETDDSRQIHSRAIAEFSDDGLVINVLVLSHDVTEEQSRYEELTRRALSDPLTGLANRATAHAYIDRSLGRRDRTGTSEAVIFLDLDRFKTINDTLGHAAGDELLITVAKRLSSVVRPHDVVSRLGGDEFVIYLEQMTGIDSVLMVVDRLRTALREPLSVAGSELRISASMGVAFAAARNETADRLIAKADAAMYKAKESGRDCVELYDEELRIRAEQRKANERALRRAIGNGEMEVHFLPEFDLEANKVVGAEALVRWRHPERGLIPAADFIGLAEETGLLIKLGNEVLRRSCELVAGWLQNRLVEEFTLRVNISPRQLAQPQLAPFVQDVLDDTKLDPSMLCLEIAEATLTEHMSDGMRQLERLRELGVKVSVDDFGTAASSLALLKVMPVDMLKIDMSFVRGLGVDPRDDAIVAAIISLGDALGIQVVAEGIDSDRQREKLLALGCRRGQGYGLSPVVRPSEFLKRWFDS